MSTGSSRRRAWARPLLWTLVTVLVAAGCAQSHSATSAVAPDTRAPAAALAPDAAVVATESGAVRGVVGADHRLFAGIPYAAPPVGPWRWQPPRATTPWTGVRDATRPGPPCIQDTSAMGSEACLTVNVWTPLRRAAGRRPVLVWLHGGGFINGHGDIYDARRLASRGDVIVVTLNYRLGALGFLAHPALGPHGRVGNYGLLDQQAALRWVRDNISHFGGDPAKVTIAGESAGGMSVCDHLVAPASAGLFRSAIIQSGPCHAQVDIDTGERISETFAADLGCGGPEADPEAIARCLRALPATRLATSPWYVHIDTHSLTGPVTGTAVLPVDPVDGFAAGRAAPVPVLVGSNHDEFTMFAALTYLRTGTELTAAGYPGALARTMGADAAAVQAQYPPARHGGSVSLAFAAAVGDHVFACVANRITEALAAHDAPVYAYEFADPRPPAPQGLAGTPFPLGASHALEVGYLFDVAGLPAPSPAQRRLSDQMIDYWARFVITGDPNGPGQPRWPAFEDRPGGARWMSLRPDGSRVTTDFAAEHQCRFWDALAAGSR